MTYATATILFLRRHRARVKDNYSSLECVNLQWLLLLAGAAAAIWVLATTLQLLEVAHHPLFARCDDAVALAIAAPVYGIGYMSLRQPEIFNYARFEFRSPPDLSVIHVTGSFPRRPGSARGVCHRYQAREGRCPPAIFPAISRFACTIPGTSIGLAVQSCSGIQ